MRDAMAALGADPQKITPLIPVELTIDHSVIADVFTRCAAFRVTHGLPGGVHEFGENECCSRQTAAMKRSSMPTTSAMVP
jgi:hypothetical protein